MQAVAVVEVARQQAHLVGLAAAVRGLLIQPQQVGLQELLTQAAAAAAQVRLLILSFIYPEMVAAALFGYGIQTAILPQQQQDHQP